MTNKMSPALNIHTYSPEGESYIAEQINNAIQDGKTVCYTHSMINMKPDPMIGSWAVVIRNGDSEQGHSGAMSFSKQPRISIHAVLKCFEFAKEKAKLLILTNNTYIPTVFENGQLEKWDQYNWNLFGGSEVKDADLWKRLLALLKEHKPQVLYTPNWYETSQIKKVKQLSLDRRSGPADSIDEVPSVKQTQGEISHEGSKKVESKPGASQKKRGSKRIQNQSKKAKMTGTAKKTRKREDSPYTSKPRISRSSK